MTRSTRDTIHVWPTRARLDVPGVVVARVGADGAAVAGQGSLQLLRHDVLVPQQRVRVRERLVDLHGALEKLDGRVVFLLQAEAVPRGAPSLESNNKQTTNKQQQNNKQTTNKQQTNKQQTNKNNKQTVHFNVTSVRDARMWRRLPPRLVTEIFVDYKLVYH